MAKTHEYSASVTWTGGRGGAGSVTSNGSGTKLDLAVPTEFGGTGKGTNPEETLTNAIAACYTMVLGIIAETQRAQFSKIETEAVAEVEENGPQFTYKSITLRPKITLESGADDAAKTKAEQLAGRADAYCIVTQAVKGNVQVTVEPEIEVG